MENTSPHNNDVLFQVHQRMIEVLTLIEEMVTYLSRIETEQNEEDKPA